MAPRAEPRPSAFRRLKSAFLALSALLLPLGAFAAPQEPGEFGAILLPVQLDHNATQTAAEVFVSTDFPGLFGVIEGAQPGPVTLSSGVVHYFYLPYSIPTVTAPDLYRLALTLLTDDPRFEVDPSSASASVSVEVVSDRNPPAPDGTAPVTTLAFEGPFSLSAGRAYLGPGTRVRLDAVDPATEGAATSGLGSTRYLVDQAFIDMATTPGTVYAEPLSLPPDAGAITYFSVDNAGNVEAPRVSSVTTDSQGPVLAIASPLGGETYGGSISSFTVVWTAFDALDPGPSVSAALVEVEDRGVPRGTAASRVGVSPGELVQTSTLDDGLWVLQVSATDFVLNASSASSGVFEVIHADNHPPATQLTLGPPSVLGDPSFVSSSTLITLSATDDLSGVASLTYSIDGATTVVFASSAAFTLTQEGFIHTLAYSAADVAGNIEAVQVSSIVVDATPPVLSFSLLGSTSTDRLGRVIISTSTLLVLSAADSLSGLAGIAYSIDGGLEVSLAVSSTSLSFPDEGTHSLAFYALDRVENRSLSFATSVVVDVSPPSFGALSAAGGDGSSGSDSTAISTTAASVQISVQDLASGLDITGAGSGPGPLSAIPGTLGLWHFDEGSGGSARDASPNAIDGNRNPNVAWLADGAIGSAVRVTPLPNSTPNAGVTLPTRAYALINNLPSGTVELWARLPLPRGPSYYTAFTVKQFDGSDTQFWFAINADGQLWHASNGLDCNTLIQVDPTRWAHFAVTWDASAAKLYKDGALVRTCNGSFPVPNDLNPTCLSIAGACGDLTMNGSRLIDEVRVLNRALSGAEIAQDASQQAKPFAARLSTDGGQSSSALALKASTSPADATDMWGSPLFNLNLTGAHFEHTMTTSAIRSARQAVTAEFDFFLSLPSPLAGASPRGRASHPAGGTLDPLGGPSRGALS